MICGDEMAHARSAKAPSAESCNPRGVGCSKESNVSGFSIRLTDNFRISSALRKLKLTLPIWDTIGRETFISNHFSFHRPGRVSRALLVIAKMLK